MSTARRAALDALTDILAGGAYANLRLKQLPALDARDVAFVSALVYTALDNLTYLDYIIAHYARGRLNGTVRNILRLGVCQLMFMDTPVSAACNESVKLTKEVGKGALSGYVNGVMRAISRGMQQDALPPLPEEPAARLSIRYSFPQYMAEEYISRYGYEFAEEMLAYKQPPGITVRAQWPYTSDELAAELDKRGVDFTRGKLCGDAFCIRDGALVTQDALFTSGRLTIQSESAMLACRALAPKPDMRILDACAAPGGKTAYIYSLMRGRGGLTAWELHGHRMQLTQNTLERLNVRGVECAVRDASIPAPELNGSFDAVLVDAPCSGLGVTGKPDARYKKSDEAIEGLAQLQRAILAVCSEYVKPGGRLVYSTCTISARENEDVATAFLAAHGDFVPVKDALPQCLAPRVPQGQAGIQLFPHLDDTEGFFIAAFDRNA